MKHRGGIALWLLLAGLVCSGPVLSQAYPAKSVRVIISFPPGGSTDIIGRLVMQRLSEVTGQQFLPDNRGGAAGTIAAALVAKSPADGYTLMVHSSTHLINAHMMKLPYDTLNDFVGVSTLARQVFMLAVHPSLPARSMNEFIALAHKRPNEIFYGSGGIGSGIHLGMAHLASLAKIQVVHTPYKGGGPATISLIAGHTQASLPSVGSVLQHIKAGQMRPLGVTSDTRVAQLPDVPAIAEAVPGYEFTGWVGVYAPAGTPRAVVDSLNATLGKILADPAMGNKLSALAFDALYLNPGQFAQRLKADYEKIGKVIRESGARNE